MKIEYVNDWLLVKNQIYYFIQQSIGRLKENDEACKINSSDYFFFYFNFFLAVVGLVSAIPTGGLSVILSMFGMFGFVYQSVLRSLQLSRARMRKHSIMLGIERAEGLIARINSMIEDIKVEADNYDLEKWGRMGNEIQEELELLSAFRK